MITPNFACWITKQAINVHHFIEVVQRTVIIFCLEPYIISKVNIS
jgi:hypothetical protein